VGVEMAVVEHGATYAEKKHFNQAFIAAKLQMLLGV